MGRRGKKKMSKGKKDNNPKSGGSSSVSPPPWIELPRDVTENILHRLGPVEILKNAEKVCTTWRSVCSKPSLWRVIDMKISREDHDLLYSLGIMCRSAVDRSQGELIDINIEYFGTDGLLCYISDRSSHLKRLRLRSCNSITSEGLIESIKHFPELEELHIFSMPSITARDIEAICNCFSCPKLKSFTFNDHSYRLPPLEIDDSYALTIAKNMPNLNHICLFGNMLSNVGLKTILDGCLNLESLDLRRCFGVDLHGDFGRICSERIKILKCPFDSTDDYEWDDMNCDFGELNYSYDGYSFGGFKNYEDDYLSGFGNLF